MARFSRGLEGGSNLTAPPAPSGTGQDVMRSSEDKQERGVDSELRTRIVTLSDLLSHQEENHKKLARLQSTRRYNSRVDDRNNGT